MKEKVMLTEKEGIDLSIELWTDLARTGKGKDSWKGWERFDYHFVHECPLCEYVKQHGGNPFTPSDFSNCSLCPYFQKFGYCSVSKDGTIFDRWAGVSAIEDKKRYAKEFLMQLLELNGDEKKAEEPEKPKREATDITEDLADRGVIVCKDCGHFFQPIGPNPLQINNPCPNCGGSGLWYITRGGSWIDCK